MSKSSFRRFFFLILFISLMLGYSDWGYECLHSFPSRGTWLGNKPYWKPANCTPRAFNTNSTLSCLANRTVYVVGISTARQFAFSIGELLGGLTVTREDQKNSCPKNSQSWTPSCQQQIHGVKIEYLFLNYMDGFNYSDRGGFPFILQNWTSHHNSTKPTDFNDANDLLRTVKEDEKYGSDQCTSFPTGQCMRKFLQHATSNDLLIFNLGLMYATYNSAILDDVAWLKHSAFAWMKHISSFPGKIFHVTLSPLHDNWAHRSYLMETFNKVLWEVWKGAAATDSEAKEEWRTIDQWAINYRRKHLYNDRIHYAGRLTDASIEQILNELCYPLGEPVQYPPDLPLDDELVGKIVNRVASDGASDLYYVDEFLTLHSFLPNSTCAKAILSRPYLNLSTASVDLLTVHKDLLRDICANDTLLLPAGSKSVLVVKDLKVHPFTSLKSFMSHGYDFGNVINVFPWEYSMLEMGNPL